jgi:hypothetical protein
MATTAKVLYRGAASTTTSTTLYTVPADTTAIVTNIVVVNSESSDLTFTMDLNDVPFATTVTVKALDSTVLDVKQVLGATETIKGGASSTGVSFHISGVEIS